MKGYGPARAGHEVIEFLPRGCIMYDGTRACFEDVRADTRQLDASPAKSRFSDRPSPGCRISRMKHWTSSCIMYVSSCPLQHSCVKRDSLVPFFRDSITSPDQFLLDILQTSHSRDYAGYRHNCPSASSTLSESRVMFSSRPLPTPLRYQEE